MDGAHKLEPSFALVVIHTAGFVKDRIDDSIVNDRNGLGVRCLSLCQNTNPAAHPSPFLPSPDSALFAELGHFTDMDLDAANGIYVSIYGGTY